MQSTVLNRLKLKIKNFKKLSADEAIQEYAWLKSTFTRYEIKSISLI